MTDPIVIVSAARTPIGGLLGCFASLSASDLGAVAVRAAVERAGLAPELIDEVLFGNCLLAGQGQSPARQAALKGGLPLSAGCTTLSKMCGSGMKAVMLAHDLIAAGSARIVLAGGMESMSNAPYLLPGVRAGIRMGNSAVRDHMFLDGLQDAYEKDASGSGRLMGTYAEDCATQFNFSRVQQDDFALASLARARAANEDGGFAWEMAPVTIRERAGEKIIARDEQPFTAQPDKIPSLKPAFRKDGTVTAANASSISDGAAALLLMRASTAKQYGLTPLARIVAHSSHAQAPGLFTTAPITAIQKLYEQTGWTTAQVDAFEVNEAFAVVAMAAMAAHEIPHEKINLHGGACALGHPIGASGARILVTLLGVLQQRNWQRGVAAICIGGGEATAMALERLS
ncbi:MAG: acetyl-CoA C-acyltransferase [Burkholderiaceae bacterium]|nr:MAG: acetyl-CoA C-acyltransferase [Burkholderiaceae bacterium]